MMRAAGRAAGGPGQTELYAGGIGLGAATQSAGTAVRLEVFPHAQAKYAGPAQAPGPRRLIDARTRDRCRIPAGIGSSARARRRTGRGSSILIRDAIEAGQCGGCRRRPSRRNSGGSRRGRDELRRGRRDHDRNRKSGGGTLRRHREKLDEDVSTEDHGRCSHGPVAPGCQLALRGEVHTGLRIKSSRLNKVRPPAPQVKPLPLQGAQPSCART